MYKLLLCLRYLRTRFLALVCIVSVMLGVGTLIVVNSVMSGFSTKLRDRLHGIYSDVGIEAYSMEGFYDAEGKMERIRSDPFLAERIAFMTPTLESFAILQYYWHGETFTRPVRLIGVDFAGRKELGGFAEHLLPQFEGHEPSFELTPAAKALYDLHRQDDIPFNPFDIKSPPGEMPAPDAPPVQHDMAESLIVGYALVHFPNPESTPAKPLAPICTLKPGDDAVVLTLGGDALSPVNYRYVVAGYFKSEMSEQDSTYIFVPIESLRKLRTMEGKATSIQVRLKNYDADHKEVVDRLKAIFNGLPIMVQTWEDKQGPLLAAIDIERGILNVLLFMIVGVAGFGILAIFSMIVVEKTRDIGILKALGASNGGVLGIFLGYGLLLGVVGAALGTGLGLSFTIYINQIEWFLSRVTGHEVFSREVYYFKEIPTNIQPLMVVLVNVGAVGIAVAFSILPALRAALLHPVRALRYE